MQLPIASEPQLLFSSSYREARARFCGSAHAAGFELRSYPIAAHGPDGEELAIDVALAPHATARRALVISSGTHGVEGYFGSAVQLGVLQSAELCTRLRNTASVVLIHAVNPYGFAHFRRCNEDNVDQNRNFVRAKEHFEGAPAGYRALSPLLNPEGPPELFDTFFARAALAVLRSGFRSLKNAIAQGQYEFPKGLFYGGSAPTESQRILRAELAGWLGDAARVLHLDLHTGVGKLGSYALCIDRPESDPRVAELKREFGAREVQGFSSEGVLYQIRGALGPWLEECMPRARYDCLLAEFGTHAALSVLAAMRFENRVHHYAALDTALRRRAQQRMLEAFCPSSPAWRRTVITRALSVVGQSLNVLA